MLIKIIKFKLILLISLSSIVVYLIKFDPKLLDNIGMEVVDYYIKYQTLNYKEALNDLSEGKDKKAIDLIKKWSNINRGNRIFQKKRSLIISYSNFLNERKKFFDIYKLTNEYLETEKNDLLLLNYNIIYALLSDDLTVQKSAFLKLKDNFYRFSSDGLFRLIYFCSGILDPSQKEDFIENYDVVKSSDLLWNIYYDYGSGYSQQNSEPIKLKKFQNDFFYEFNNIANLKKIRIDPPGYKLIEISNVRLVIDDIAYKISINDIDKINDLKKNYNSLISDHFSLDPYFSIDIKSFNELKKIKDPTKFKIFFSISLPTNCNMILNS